VQSDTVDNSMDHSDMSAMSHDAEDDKSLILQYEGRQLLHSVMFSFIVYIAFVSVSVYVSNYC